MLSQPFPDLSNPLLFFHLLSSFQYFSAIVSSLVLHIFCDKFRLYIIMEIFEERGKKEGRCSYFLISTQSSLIYSVLCLFWFDKTIPNYVFVVYLLFSKDRGYKLISHSNRLY